MLIELDGSLVAALEAAPNPMNPVASAIDTAAQAETEGLHILWGSFETFSSLQGLQAALNPRTIATLRKAFNDLPQRKALSDVVVRRVILHGNAGGIVRVVAGQNVSISIPAQAVAVSAAILGKPALVVENLTDAEFYASLERTIAENAPRCD